MTDRPRGYVPRSPEEIEAAWADARRVVRAERPMMRRRALASMRTADRKTESWLYLNGFFIPLLLLSIIPLALGVPWVLVAVLAAYGIGAVSVVIHRSDNP